MKATTNESVSQGTNPILQLRRPLLSIDEYAARRRLSKHAVEQRVQSGAIQIRKCKGKTYVVDLPLSPHQHTPEELSLMEEDAETKTYAIEHTAQSADTAHADRVAHAGSIGEAPLITNVSQGVQITDSELPRPSILSTVTLTRHARKVAAVSATVCLLAVIIASFYLYVNQTIHAERLDKAYTTIQRVHGNSIQTSQQLAALQTNLVDSTVELQSVKNELNKTTAQVTKLQNELKRVSQSLETTGSEPTGSAPQVTELRNLLNNTRAEVQTLRSEIAQAGQSLDAIKQQNTTALERLRGQIQQLTALLSELGKNSRPPTEPNTTGE